MLQTAIILKEEGYNVTVWTLRAGEFEEEFQKAGMKVVKIDFLKEISEKMAGELRDFSLVIANTIFTAPFAKYAQKYAKTILYIREARNIPQIMTSCAMEETDIMLAEHIVCVSEYAEEFIRDKYNQKDISVIHNYVEDCFQKKYRGKNMLLTNRTDFLVSGTVEPRKGQSIAVDAFLQLIKEGKNRKIYLHIVGAMPEWAGEYQKNLGLSLHNWIIYHGEIHDRRKLLNLYEKMDVILVPSLDESCSLVVLEAAMLGKAVILTENTGAKYLVDSACIVETGNSKKLAEKMREYIHNPKKVEEDGKRNRINYLGKATKELYRKEFLSYIHMLEQQKNISTNDGGIKVSIVVPVYNVENYLAVCLESILGQTLKDVEIICVNDGSTDNSPYILREYEEKDLRIKVFHTSNQGYGHAVNLGMVKAVGQYIGIVEPDDYVDVEMFEKLYHTALAMDADIVKSDFYRFYGNGKEQENVYCLTARKLENYGRIICPREEKECFRYVMNTWTGIYRREFLMKYQIFHNESPGASFQDNGFWFQGFCHAERLVFVNQAFYYNRRDNPHSSVHNRQKVYCANMEYSFIRNFLKTHPCLEKEFLFQFSLKKYHTYLFTLDRIGWEYKKEYLSRISEELREAEQKGELCQAVFTPQEWTNLQWIIRNDTEYFEKVVKRKIRISVVIPVYNVQDYLYECLRSLEKQHFHYFEVICVDEGSTDSSMEIMTAFADRDIRFRICRQQSCGAGAAKNKGMENALGEYIVFLNAEDFFEPEMLLNAYRKIQEDDADICLMNSWQCGMQPKKLVLCHEQNFFRIEDVGQNPFRSFSGCVWDKLYRRSFLINNGLKFQEQEFYEDMYFTYMSLWKADKIVVLTDKVICHKENRAAFIFLAEDMAWECFYEAWKLMGQELKKMGLFERYRKEYVNYALHVCLCNLKTLPENLAENFLEKLEETWFDNLEISSLDSKDFEVQEEHEDYQKIKEQGKKGLWICREKDNDIKRKKEEKKTVQESMEFRSDAEYYQFCLNEIRKSKSYKIGRAITWLPRKIRGW